MARTETSTEIAPAPVTDVVLGTSVKPVQPVKLTAAPDSKPLPETRRVVVVVTVAEGTMAEGLIAVIWLPITVNIGPDVKLPPSALMTVTV